MTIKTTGKEMSDFYKDKSWWPEGVWHEDEEVEIDGFIVEEGSEDLGNICDTAQVKITGGCVTQDTKGTYKDLGSFEGYFKKWRAQQKNTTFSVTCPKDKLKSVEAAIKMAGGKII